MCVNETAFWVKQEKELDTHRKIVMSLQQLSSLILCQTSLQDKLRTLCLEDVTAHTLGSSFLTAAATSSQCGQTETGSLVDV